jgi:hypothetical protein
VEYVLKGGVADRIPFTAYASKIPQCAAERKLRNMGLCLVRRDVNVVKTVTPNVKVTHTTYQEDGKNLIRTDYDTPAGNLHVIVEDVGITKWPRKRLFGGQEDYKALLALVKDVRYIANYQAYAAVQADDGGDSFLRGSVGSEPLQWLISTVMGAETFSMEWYDRQDEVLKLYDALVEQRRRSYQLLADSPCLAFNYGGNVTPEIIGVERFEKYYVPNYNEAADILHRKGKLLGVHFDANCRVLSDAIAKSNLDYIEAFTPAPDTDMNLTEARAAWPDKALWINWPSSVHLADLETVERTTHDLIDQAGDRRGLIMGITEDVPKDRWQENMRIIGTVISERAGQA